MDLSTYTTILTTNEIEHLTELEETIRQGLQTFVDVGTALLEIRDGRLYRNKFNTFEDYCQERWGMGQSRTYQLMDAAQVFNNIKSSTIVELLPANEAQARPLTSLEPEEQRQIWEQAVKTAPNGKITASHVQGVVDAIKRPVSYHVSDDSYEWYTPSEYIDAARSVLGEIDLDPASSERAQTIIKANTYYTKENNGLLQPWFGNIWLNPPYNMPLIEQFINRVIKAYSLGEIHSAIVLTNNSTDTNWFHLLVNYPVCFTKGRIKFYSDNGILGTRQGQALFYLGNNLPKFASEFGKFGVILCRYDY